MNRFRNAKTKKLHPAEWNFEAVSDECSRSVLFYEYFRQSEKLRKLVLQLREMENPAMGGNWPVGYMPLTIERRRFLRKKINGGETFESLVQALINCPKFPETPALKLRDQNWVQELERVEAVKWCEGEITDNQDLSHATDQILHKPGIEYCFNGNLKTREYQSVFVLMIDWRKPDAEIADGFRNKVLSFRPERFQQFYKISPEQAAFGSLCEKLPFKPHSGLVWLGVLRRFEAAGKSWSEYLELHGGNMRERLRRAGFESWRRQRLRDCQRAREICAWLESGAKEKLLRSQFR